MKWHESLSWQRESPIWLHNTKQPIEHNRIKMNNNLPTLLILFMLLFLLLEILLYWICFHCSIGNLIPLFIFDVICFGTACALIFARLYYKEKQELQQESRGLESDISPSNMEVLIHKTEKGKQEQEKFDLLSTRTISDDLKLKIVINKSKQTKPKKQKCKRNTISLLLMLLFVLFGILLYWLCFRCNISNFIPLFMFDIIAFMIVCLNGKEKDNDDIELNEQNDYQTRNDKRNNKRITSKKNSNNNINSDRKDIKSKTESNKKGDIEGCSTTNEQDRASIAPNVKRENEKLKEKQHYDDQYRIFRYQFGNIKSIDSNIICKYFSLKHISKYRLINKYFNDFIGDRMNDIIWNDVCHSLQFIPMKMKEKEKIIINNRNIATTATQKASEIFWHLCTDNGVEIDTLVKILEKNSLCKKNGSTNHQNKSNFVNKLNKKCGHFLKQREYVKTQKTTTNIYTTAKCTNNFMFMKKLNDKDWFDTEEMEIRLKTLVNIKPDNHKSSNNTCHILKFIQLIDKIVYDVKKYNKKLWTNETNFYKYYPKCEQLYDDLFDIFYYFGWYLGNEDKHNYNKNEGCYFYESILTWIIVKFLDKLPITPQFIGDFGDPNRPLGHGKYTDDNRCHLDWGGVSFMEFFITFKTHMAMKYPFLNQTDYTVNMKWQGDSDLFTERYPAHFYHLLCLSDNWFDYIGLWRTNFVLSMYFLSNDKHLGNRNHLINVMLLFGNDYDTTRPVRNRKYYCSGDVTLKRLEFMFLHDARAFGPRRADCEFGESVITAVHFNPWTWISLYQDEKEKCDRNDRNRKKKLAIVANGHKKNVEKLRNSGWKEYVEMYDKLGIHNEDRLRSMECYVLSECDGTDCFRSCNCKFENLNDKIFQDKIKQMMQLLHETNG